MKKVSLGVVLLTFCLISSGCTFKNSLGYLPESDFSPPNSNVVPMEEVKGKSSLVSIGIVPPGVSGSMIRKAIDDAKSKSAGADTLLNLQGTTTMVQVPTFFTPISFYSTTVEVQGVAAKIETGKQKLQ